MEKFVGWDKRSGPTNHRRAAPLFPPFISPLNRCQGRLWNGTGKDAPTWPSGTWWARKVFPAREKSPSWRRRACSVRLVSRNDPASGACLSQLK